MQNLSHNIKTLRKAKALTQEELASQLHVTRQAVSSWERGNSCPDFDTLKALAEILDATPEQLLYGADSGKPPKLRRVRYELAIFASLALGTLCFLGLEFIGLALFFAVLIPVCTCVILDEIRNGTYWQQFHREEDNSDDESDGAQI